MHDLLSLERTAASCLVYRDLSGPLELNVKFTLNIREAIKFRSNINNYVRRKVKLEQFSLLLEFILLDYS